MFQQEAPSPQEQQEFLAAFSGGNLKEAERLLKKDGRLANVEFGAERPLHLAAQSGNDAMLSLLLDHGAKINAVTVRNETPLHYAVWYGQAKAAALLMRRGADASIKNKVTGLPAFLSAIDHNHVEVVCAMADAGANFSQKTADGRNIYQVAVTAHSDDTKMLDCLWGTARQKEIQKEEQWREQQARKKYPEPPPPKKTQAMLNEAGPEGTALQESVKAGGFKKFEWLLNHGADPKIPNLRKETTLHTAAMYNQQDMAARLLEKGVDISAKDAKGRTAMHHAIMNGHVEMVELLLVGRSAEERKALLEAADNEGKTPAHLAAQNAPDEQKAAAALAAVFILKREGVVLDRKDKHGNTALHDAARDGNVVYVKALLGEGLNASERNNAKGTPLHAAVKSIQPFTAEALSNSPVALFAKDAKGRTPLALALELDPKLDNAHMMLIAERLKERMKRLGNMPRIIPLSAASETKASPGLADLGEALLSQGVAPKQNVLVQSDVALPTTPATQSKEKSADRDAPLSLAV